MLVSKPMANNVRGGSGGSTRVLSNGEPAPGRTAYQAIHSK